MDSGTGPEVVDHGLLDVITRTRRWESENDDGKVTRREQTKQYPIPENIMATLEEHLGDAQAKVTVGADLALSKEYGCKAGAFVSVSVACNNNEADIEAVHSIVQPLARKLVNEDLKLMIEDRDAHLGSGTPPPPGKVAAPKVKPKAAPAAGAQTTKPAVARPSFRR